MSLNESNALSRIFDVLEKAETLGRNSRRPANEVWIKVFELSDALDAQSKTVILCHHLLQLDSEVCKAIDLIDTGDYRVEDDLKAQLNRIRTALSPTLLHHDWQEVVKHIKPEPLLAIKYSKRNLPNDEMKIPDDEVNELQELCDQLRIEINNSKLPTSLKVDLLRRLHELSEELLKIKYLGYGAFRKEAESFSAMIALNPDLRQSLDELKADDGETLLNKIVKIVFKSIRFFNTGCTTVKNIADTTEATRIAFEFL